MKNIKRSYKMRTVTKDSDAYGCDSAYGLTREQREHIFNVKKKRNLK